MDPDQFDQLLINLVKNAADASLETSGAVAVGWDRNGQSVEVFVCDEGHGIMNSSNLFVPFFTTKPGRHRHRAGAVATDCGSAWRRASRWRIGATGGMRSARTLAPAKLSVGSAGT